MFASIAAFEFRYQLRNPVFWFVSILFFLLTFGAVVSENVQIGSGGNVNVNSPGAISLTMLVLTIFFMFVTTAFVANVIVRDDDSGFGPMVRSTRVSKFDYLIGRFTGAFGISAFSFLSVPLAILIGSAMPWIDPETVGPTRLSYYAVPYLVFALPGIFLTSALFFAVATMTRSMMASYVAVVAFLILYLVFSAATEFDPELMLLGAWLDPFGGGAYEMLTRYWTAAERNSLTVPLEGVLIGNRALWILVGLAALAFAYGRFTFAERASSKRQLQKQEREAAALADESPLRADTLPAPSIEGLASSRLVVRTRHEMRQVFLSPAFFILIAFGLFNSIAALSFSTSLYGTPAFPRTFAVLELLQGTFTIIPLVIAIFYGGELVWRDRDVRISEIIDASAVPNWAFMLPKTLAVVGVLLASLAISVVGAMLVQLLKGYTTVELTKYLTWYVLPTTVEMFSLAILSVFVQALSPNKYIGWALMLVYLVATITFNSMGYDHPLYLFGRGIAVPLSDMNGADVSAAGAWWLRLYWLAFSVMLAVTAHALWRRGTAVSVRAQMRQAPRRLTGLAGMVMAGAAVVFIGTGVFVFHNTNQLNVYETNDAGEERLADYEKTYLQYESLKQPSFTDMVLNIDLYPEALRMEASGTLTMINDTGAPVESLHVRFEDQRVRVDAVDIPGAVLVEHDEANRYRIYALDPPLEVGETRALSFRSSREQRGFRAKGNDTRLVRNGTFLNNAEFAPSLGMSRDGLLSDRATRRKYDLPAELRPARLEDESARERNYVGDADWVTSDITVSTVPEQTPIAPGSRVSDEIVDGRRVARFVARSPILAFFSVQSANYEVRSRTADGVDMEVYFHPDHDFNVDRMLDATEQSLAYYKANFGPYQFDYARIIEFPAYASFAQAFAGTVPYSETLGFIADVRNPDSIDYVTYVTAHEFGHQYWAHQLISADQQGGTMLVESMAQYSALMVMKAMLGEDKIRRFLKYELDRYLSARGSEAIEELPLYRVENQPYIHYRKGAVVLYLLQDRLGEARVNAMLARLLDQYRFKSQPYASSLDLVAGFRSLARDEAEETLVADLLERITIYDLKVEDAVVEMLDDGRYRTTLSVVAGKAYADGLGSETEAPLDDTFDVGLFTARPGLGVFGAENVLHMERRAVTSGAQTIEVISDVAPTYAGVDPYNKFIDRNSDDNVVAVSGE